MCCLITNVSVNLEVFAALSVVAPGNVKLVSLSNAVKMAVSGNIEIPSNVIQKLTDVSKVSGVH